MNPLVLQLLAAAVQNFPEIEKDIKALVSRHGVSDEDWQATLKKLERDSASYFGNVPAANVPVPGGGQNLPPSQLPHPAYDPAPTPVPIGFDPVQHVYDHRPEDIAGFKVYIRDDGRFVYVQNGYGPLPPAWRIAPPNPPLNIPDSTRPVDSLATGAGSAGDVQVSPSRFDQTPRGLTPNIGNSAADLSGNSSAHDIDGMDGEKAPATDLSPSAQAKTLENSTSKNTNSNK